MEKVKIISFDDYKKKVSENVNKKEFYLYRGQHSCGWSLDSTFSRFCKNNGEKFEIKYFNYILERFIAEASCFMGKELANQLDYLQRVALAQHYGLPTPFLDWTDSPYIAAFFAIGHRSIKDVEPFRIWVLSIREDSDCYLKNADYNEMKKDFYIIDTQFVVSKRLRRQRGYFSYFKNEMLLEEYLEKEESGVKLFYYDINGDSWLSIMKELSLMGISHNNLFDNLDGIATDVSLDFLHGRMAKKWSVNWKN